MTFFANLSILHKILALLSLLGLVSVAATFYAGASLHRVNDRYDAILQGPAKGTVALARTNQQLASLNRAIYKLVNARTDTASEAAQKDMGDAKASFTRFLAEARNELPNHRAEIDSFAADFSRTINKTCDDTISTAEGAIGSMIMDTSIMQATSSMEASCDPAMIGLTVRINSTIDAIVAENDHAATGMARDAGAAVWAIYATVLGGLVVILILAVYLTHRGIIGPIQALVTAMGGLAENDLRIDIPGTQRRDEIGVMGRAVMVFKDGMIRADTAASAEARENAAKEKLARALEDLVRSFEAKIGAMTKTLAMAATDMQPVVMKALSREFYPS